MKRHFLNLIKKHTPQVNRDIVDGLATKVIPYAMEYINSNFKSISKSFPEGLVYLGCERCTPQEEYNILKKKSGTKKGYDLAKESIYLVKFKFRYFEEDMDDMYLYLPYVEDAGLMYIHDALYQISPMLTDKAISPDKSQIFVKLLKVKLIFERSIFSYVVDGSTEHVYYMHSKIYKKEGKNNKIVTTNLHYLLAKYGLTETFQRYLGFVPIVGDETTVNVMKYPRDKWVICKSTGVNPNSKRFKKVKDYTPSPLRMAIPREHWNDLTSTVVGNFFYIVSHFPEIQPDWMDSRNKWMYLLGCIIFSPDYGVGRIIELINEHLCSLDNYLDDIIKDMISELGYNVQSFYDILFIVIKEFGNLINAANEACNSLYNRNFEILYYILLPLIRNFVTMNYELIRKANKKGAKPLDKDSVQKTISRHFKMRCIVSINKKNECVNSVSYSGDNKYPKITAICGLQQSSDSGKKGKSSKKSIDTSKHLHVSNIEIGSLLALSKSNPHAAYRTNCFCKVSIPDGKIIRNPEFIELLDRTQEDFRRRTIASSDAIDLNDVTEEQDIFG